MTSRPAVTTESISARVSGYLFTAGEVGGIDPDEEVELALPLAASF